MKKTLIQFLLALCVSTIASNAMALTDDFYASGEDLDYMFDGSDSFAFEEIENELRRFVIYRKLENLLFDFSDDYPGISQ